MMCEIATLGHKVLNHSVEGASFVGVLLFVIASAERSKVFSSLWNIILEKLNFDLTYFFILPQNVAHRSGLHFLRP